MENEIRIDFFNDKLRQLIEKERKKCFFLNINNKFTHVVKHIQRRDQNCKNIIKKCIFNDYER